VDTNQINLATAGQIIEGIAPSVLETSYPGSRIVTPATVGSIFNISMHGVRVEGLGFEGTAALNSALTAIKAAKLTNTDDLDFTQINTHARNVNTFTDACGRGFTAKRNTFAGGPGVDRMFVRSFPTSGIGPGLWQDLPYGFRWKDQIHENHGHGVSNLLVVEGDARQYYCGSITHNIMDIGGRLYQGGGMLDLSHNEVKHSGTTIVYLDAPTSGRFAFNMLRGTPGDLTYSPAYCFWAADKLSKFTMVGNEFGDSRGSAVYFAQDVEHGSISDNIFDNYGQDLTGIDSGILLEAGKRMKRVSIVGNTMIEGSGSDHPFCAKDGSMLNQVRMSRNTWDRAKGAFVQGAFVDEGLNDLE
jgi:hypothetical protein